jgi:endonuclease/exonuclease/phosphatase family metal-dependent hydrolase
LLNEFAAALAGWEWDVALLQEVPPWWPRSLARACGAEWRVRLTSRNLGLRLRRGISARNPDVLKANGGGCNAILVRGTIETHAWVRVRVWPERRYAHGVRLADGSWAVNLHASTGRFAWPDTLRALAAAQRWSGGARLLFGGDLNVRGRPSLPGLVWLGGHDVDHLYGLRTASRPAVLERGRLSDHAPVRVTL